MTRCPAPSLTACAKLFDSLPSEQMRKTLAAIPSMQLREAVDRLDAPNREIKKQLKPSEDARDWIKKGDFASSEALAGLIDPLVLPKKKAR